MRKIKFIIFGLVALSTLLTYGQQDPQYTQYTYNMNVVNPAYAGSQGTLSIGLLARTQWVNLPGAPQTITAVIHAPVGRNVGLGLSAIADEIGKPRRAKKNVISKLVTLLSALYIEQTTL